MKQCRKMDASPSEIDTFKIMSNVDFVDWSRTRAETIAESPPRKMSEENTPKRADSPKVSPRASPGVSRVSPKVSPRATPQVSQRPSPVPSHKNSPKASERASPARHDTPERARSFTPPPAPRYSPRYSPRGRRDSESSKRTPLPSSPSPIPVRAIPKPRKYTAREENDDYEILAEKEGILQDLLGFEKTSGIRLSRKWDVNENTLDELQFEYERIKSEMGANQTVEYAKAGIKFGIGGIEALLKRSGVASVDGWTSNSCKDMNKYNRPLFKLYKRYWRKTSMSPVTELGFLMFGSLVWTVVENKMGMRTPAAPPAPSAPVSTSWEPPARPMRPPSAAAAPSWSASPSLKAPSLFSQVPQVPQAPESPQVLQAPRAAPQAPQAPQASQAPQVPQAPPITIPVTQAQPQQLRTMTREDDVAAFQSLAASVQELTKTVQVLSARSSPVQRRKSPIEVRPLSTRRSTARRRYDQAVLNI